VPVREQPELPVFHLAYRELEVLALDRTSNGFHELEQSSYLRLIFGIRNEMAGRTLLSILVETGQATSVQVFKEAIRNDAITMHLNSEVESFPEDQCVEPVEFGFVCRRLGKARVPRELQEVVHVTIETVDEGTRPGESDERYSGIREGGAKGSKSRN